MGRSKTIFSEEYTSLISALKAERLRLGLSQQEVADALEITQSEISKIETLERRIDILEFKMFLKAYRVTTNNHLRGLVMIFFELEKPNG